MSFDRLINVLVTVTLVEMMVTVGLGVSCSDVLSAAKQWRLVLRALLANYLVVPATTVALLLLYHANAMVAAGFLILAACPGAPYGPPLTAIAKGNVSGSVGLMVILASSSSIVAPPLLAILLPVTSESATVQIDARQLFATLLLTQLLPLCAGLAFRAWRTGLAARLLAPAILVSKILNVATISSILATQYATLLAIRLVAFAGMFALLLASLAAGWLLGGRAPDDRRALALTTSLRNVGVSLVIAAGNFPGTPALTAVLAYALIELLGCLGLALWWGRRAASPR
jgi:bile acid:Na+ symporter, BASS family